MNLYKTLSIGFFSLFFLSSCTQTERKESSREFSGYSTHQMSSNYEDMVAGEFHSNIKGKRKNKKYPLMVEDSWKPYFIRNILMEPVKSYFFQMNMGIGLLRFSGIEGGTSSPGQVSAQMKLEGALNYSRTPLCEVNLGVKIIEWFAFALSYQHQGVVDIQSERQQARALTSSAQIIDQFKANLRLDALFAKGYFLVPTSLIWKSIAFTPYLGMGCGLSYQSWTQLQLQSEIISSGSPNRTLIKSLKNKYSENVFYMFDLGIYLRSVQPNIPFSVDLGCKYNGWGQARSMGKADQQNGSFFLSQPIRIKVLYQFAPYIGVQWNY